MRFSTKIKLNTIYIWTSFAILTFLVGFRWNVGIDWQAYMNLFGDNSIMLANKETRIELGNIIIKGALVIWANLHDGGYYLWIMGFLTMFFFFYSIKRDSVSPILSILLFITLGFYFDLMNGVRQYLAVSLFMFSWQFLFDKQFVRYVVVILVAATFHSSVIMLLPVYFICNCKFDKKVLVIIAIIAVFLSFVISSVVGEFASMFEKYEVYGDSEHAKAGGILSYLRILFPLILFAVIMSVYDTLINNSRRIRILTNLSLFSIFITLFFPTTALMIRLGWYFQISFIVFIPIICRILSQRDGLLLKSFSLVYSMLYVITIYSRPVSNIIPFKLDFRLADFILLKILIICLLCSSFFVFLLTFKRIVNKK